MPGEKPGPTDDGFHRSLESLLDDRLPAGPREPGQEPPDEEGPRPGGGFGGGDGWRGGPWKPRPRKPGPVGSGNSKEIEKELVGAGKRQT